MRLIYHPDAEAELIESARFYEQRVPSLGGQFLDAAEHPGGWCAAISDAAFPFCCVLPRLAGSPSHSGVQASQPRSRLFALSALSHPTNELGQLVGWF